MSDQETNQVLLAILNVLREQTVYLHRQHGWLIAVADAVETNTDLDAFLKKHPFYNQSPRPDVRITDEMLRTIDALIQRLNQSQ